ncbi:MAG: DUF126 domain-containing protein [Pseudomonadota bacterium]
MALTGHTLYAGDGAGPLLRLTAPISLWGGVAAKTGIITARGHPQCGKSLARTVAWLPGLIGSSSSASIMLELINNGVAPAAVLLARSDAILVTGCIVAGEMGLRAPPVVLCALGAAPGGNARVLAGPEGATIWLGGD